MKRLFAKLFGYFWLPCPICGNWYGGFEIAKTGLLTVRDISKGKTVCKKCEKTVIAINAIKYRIVPLPNCKIINSDLRNTLDDLII